MSSSPDRGMAAEVPLDAGLPADHAAGHAYASIAYARTLLHAGQPFALPAWRTPVLLRPVPGAPGRVDAMGPYPVCVLAPDADIDGGLGALQAAGAVSVVLVCDALRAPDAAGLERHFPLCRPFKTHYVIDRRAGPVTASKHHRDRIRRGERHAAARLVSLRDAAWRDHWARLYAGLVAHRGITGLQAFSIASFDALARLPDSQLLAFAAESPAGEVLAMQLWIRHGDCAYSHLTATSEAGYRALATYVVYAAAINHLGDCRQLDLGGGAGLMDNPDDTLASFKRGFANTTAMSMLCGAILDEPAYRCLTADRVGTFFPAYRMPL